MRAKGPDDVEYDPNHRVAVNERSVSGIPVINHEIKTAMLKASSAESPV
jgi:hypothetical protein